MNLIDVPLVLTRDFIFLIKEIKKKSDVFFALIICYLSIMRAFMEFNEDVTDFRLALRLKYANFKISESNYQHKFLNQQDKLCF